MGESTHISWADATLNWWTGCTKVSPACDGCYAEHLMATRHKRVVWGPHGKRDLMKGRVAAIRSIERLSMARVEGGGRPYFVFCMSLGDVFDNQVPPEWRAELFAEIRKATHCIFLLLTKRPGNIVKMAQEAGGLPPNAAIGCTVVSQPEADRDIPVLLQAKAILRALFAFVSMEPLQGLADIAWALSHNPLDVAAGFLRRGMFSPGLETLSGLDWVIAGGETDQGAHKARPSHPDWFGSLRDQCAAAGVPFHFKQWGEWAPDRELNRPFVAHRDAHAEKSLGQVNMLQSSRGQYAVAWQRCSEPLGSVCEGVQLHRMGKKVAGRVLDGAIHDARPTPSSAEQTADKAPGMNP